MDYLFDDPKKLSASGLELTKVKGDVGFAVF